MFIAVGAQTAIDINPFEICSFWRYSKLLNTLLGKRLAEGEKSRRKGEKMDGIQEEEKEGNIIYTKS